MLLRFLVLLLCAVTVPALAHTTPSVVLGSDREAIRLLLPEAKKFSVREVRLRPEQRAQIRAETGSSPDKDRYRFHVGRDDEHEVGAVAFLSEFTVHGPVRVAVAVAPDGTIAGAKVMEVSDEAFAWVKPLVDRGLERSFVGKDARGNFTLAEGNAMEKVYATVIGGLVRRAAAIYQAAVPKRK